MMSRKYVSLFAAIVAVCLCANAQAQVVSILLGNFEGGSLDGWLPQTDSGGDGMGDTTPTLSTTNSPVVASLGTGALRINNATPSHNFWAINLDNTARPTLTAELGAAAAAGGSLKADVNFIASQFPDAANNWAQFNTIAVQTTANGWNQFGSVADPGWNAGQGDLRYTYEWPLASIDTSGGAFSKIILAQNYARSAYNALGNSPDFWVDNIRIEYVIPEPTSAALAGLAFLGLGLRRRS